MVAHACNPHMRGGSRIRRSRKNKFNYNSKYRRALATAECRALLSHAWGHELKLAGPQEERKQQKAKGKIQKATQERRSTQQPRQRILQTIQTTFFESCKIMLSHSFSVGIFSMLYHYAKQCLLHVFYVFLVWFVLVSLCSSGWP